MIYYVHNRGEVTELASVEDLYTFFGITNHKGRQARLRRAIDQESLRSFHGSYISTSPTWTPGVPKPSQRGVKASLDMSNETNTHAAVKRMYLDPATDRRTLNTIEDRYLHVVGPVVADIRKQHDQADADGKAVYVERYGHVIDF